MLLGEVSTTVAVVYGSTMTTAPRCTTVTCSAFVLKKVLNTSYNYT